MNIRAIVAGFLLLAAVAAAQAAVLDSRTLDAWNRYIHQARSRMEERLQAHRPFLWVDEDADLKAQVQQGQIVVEPVGATHPVPVPSGLIHDWIGAAFLPNATLEDVLGVVTDYSRYKEFYRPLIVDSKPLGSVGTDYQFSLVVLNKTLFSTSALQCTCHDEYYKMDARRWYSIGYGDSIREIEHYGQPDQRELPSNEGNGYIWRLFSLTRFERRDGGVYVEREIMALSRDIPALLRWFLSPIVNRLSRSSLSTSLSETRQAVLSYGEMARQRDAAPALLFRQETALAPGQD